MAWLALEREPLEVQGLNIEVIPEVPDGARGSDNSWFCKHDVSYKEKKSKDVLNFSLWKRRWAERSCVYGITKRSENGWTRKRISS